LGLTHDDWQRAYALLQFIMQIVTVEVCASLIYSLKRASMTTLSAIVAGPGSAENGLFFLIVVGVIALLGRVLIKTAGNVRF
jgi:hypothetical protein